MFGCFDWLNGGRVGEIVNQEAGWCTTKNGEDKVEKFCETYKDFINVVSAHQMFLRNWENEKKSGSASLFRALRKSFTGDFMKACISKLVWSLLLIFSIWFFVFEILDFIKKKDKGVVHPTEKYEFYLCVGFFWLHVCAVDRNSANGHLLNDSGIQGEDSSHDRDLQEDDCS